MKKEGFNLIAELQAVQDRYGYLPMDVLKTLSKEHKIPGTEIFAVATFYNQFKFDKPAKHTIQVCTGTACHVKRSADLLSQIQKTLKIRPGEITKDGLIKLETVNCIGACAKAPAMMVDDKVYGLVDQDKLRQILGALR